MIRHLLPPMINKLYMKSIPAPPEGLLPPSSSTSVLHLFAQSLCFKLIHPPLSSQEWRRGEGGGELPPPLLLFLPLMLGLNKKQKAMSQLLLLTFPSISLFFSVFLFLSCLTLHVFCSSDQTSSDQNPVTGPKH